MAWAESEELASLVLVVDDMADIGGVWPRRAMVSMEANLTSEGMGRYVDQGYTG